VSELNIKAKVNISHIDSTEHHDIYKDGEFELVERPDGTYLVQVILGDMCAAAIVDKADFDKELPK